MFKKLLTLSVATIALALAACSKSDNNNKAPAIDASKLQGYWQITNMKINGQDMPIDSDGVITTTSNGLTDRTKSYVSFEGDTAISINYSVDRNVSQIVSKEKFRVDGNTIINSQVNKDNTLTETSRITVLSLNDSALDVSQSSNGVDYIAKLKKITKEIFEKSLSQTDTQELTINLNLKNDQNGAIELTKSFSKKTNEKSEVHCVVDKNGLNIVASTSEANPKTTFYLNVEQSNAVANDSQYFYIATKTSQKNIGTDGKPRPMVSYMSPEFQSIFGTNIITSNDDTSCVLKGSKYNNVLDVTYSCKDVSPLAQSTGSSFKGSVSGKIICPLEFMKQ